MACRCGCESHGGACLCGSFTKVEDVVGGTLVEALGGTIDCVRDLYTSLGLRTYQVSLVWTRWTGGARGVGNEYIVQVLPLLPTPKLGELTALELELKEIGMNEAGTLSVSELSPRFTEDLLMGRAGPMAPGQPLPPDVEFFWEVFQPERAGSGIRRRFFPSSVPNKSAGGFEWTISLKEQEGARQRDGRLQ